jgi:hypothetical protein
LEFAAVRGGCDAPKSTMSQKNLPSMYWYPFSHHCIARVICDMFYVTRKVLLCDKYPQICICPLPLQLGRTSFPS